MAESSSVPAAAAKSDAETEELLDRMLTRLALCDDSKLQALLSKLLPLTISSLSSSSQLVRNKVLEILSHVNKRVKHQPEIGLPLTELWSMYTEADATPMVKNFCIVYIEMAFERAPLKEKENLSPMLVVNISKLPQQHQEILMRIATKVIGECHASRVENEIAAKGGSSPGLSIAQANRISGKVPLKGDMLLTRKGASAAVLTELESLLLNNCQVEESEVRFCALRWATSVFDSQHCPSRFICMLGAADSRLDIREIALEGLFLGKDAGQIISQNLDHRYPKLGEMLDYILKQQPKLLDSYELREQKLLFPSKMYVAMIKFLLKCFESELVQNSSLGRSSEFLSSVERMCLLLEHAMAFEGSVELHSTTSKALVTIGSYLPEMVSSHFASRISWLKHLLSHVDMDTRESVARLLGIASSSLPVTASSDLIRELVSLFSGTNKRFEVQHGALCATGFVTADCVSRTPSIQEELLQNTLKCLVDVVNSESATLASISMQALGHIGLSGSLPSLVCDSSSVSILELLNEKLSKLLSGDDNKAVQKIVISIGHMCVKETSASNMKIALDLIFSLCRSKVEDILFAAGEALSFIWGGVPVTADVILKTNYTSLSMTSNFLMGDMKLSLSKYSSDEKNVVSEDCHIVVRDTISKKLFDALLYSSRKEERCAGTVWLLSLTMYCGDHPTIQQMLPEIQQPD
ncbi:hypothetical protein GOBAR_DD36687 [Gossypium barbadense]|nr:hypothetical protein GOBAR_DD36687 [Gossypium barbadense]